MEMATQTDSAPAGGQGKPNDDPALAMSVLWRDKWRELEQLSKLASRREQTMFDADDAGRPEAERAFEEVRKVRDRAADRVETMIRGIFKMKASSLEGVFAKLDVAMRYHAPSETSDEPQWQHFRSVLRDLHRFATTKQ